MDEEKKQDYRIRVYKIYYADAPDAIYIGSTKLTLARRMTEHRAAAKKGKTSLIYTTMRVKGINNFQYVLLDSFLVSNVDEQRMFEQTYIETLKPTLNTNRVYRTDEEYNQLFEIMNELIVAGINTLD